MKQNQSLFKKKMWGLCSHRVSSKLLSVVPLNKNDAQHLFMLISLFNIKIIILIEGDQTILEYTYDFIYFGLI